ncbi:MAG: GAF domain-containing protein [Rhodococcus sp. (in: high G+C Gram-positive bacteria)]
MEQRGRGDGWILVEILGDAPTVIAEGIKQRQCRPLGNVYRGRMLTLVAGAIDTVKSSRQPVQVTLGETVGDIDLVVGKPVLGPGGDVLAVQIYTGRANDPVPQPHRAAGWEWNLSVAAGPRRTRWTREFRNLYGVADARPEHGYFGLADLYRRVPRISDIAVLMERVDNARDGEFLSGELVARHDDGALRLVRFVRRAVATPEGVVLRGVDHDVTHKTDVGELAIRVMDSDVASTVHAVAGVHAALVDSQHGYVIKWITGPLAGLSPEAEGGQIGLLHGEDLAAVRQRMPGRRPGPVRVAVSDGSWTRHTVRAFPVPGYGSTPVVMMTFSGARAEQHAQQVGGGGCAVPDCQLA